MKFNNIINSILEEKKLSLDKKLFKKIANYSVYLVNGEYIRKEIDEEFNNFGQHYRFKQIPLNEFWIDSNSEISEYQFYIDHLLKEYSLITNGLTYKKALKQADKVEQKERNRVNKKIVKLKKESREKQLEKIHYKKYDKFETSDNLTIWLVNGEAVRDLYDIDFVEGGHGYVYSFVPKTEIWLEKDLFKDEIDYILLHESNEMYHMKKYDWSYTKAHYNSSDLEHKYRDMDDKEKLNKEVQNILNKVNL